MDTVKFCRSVRECTRAAQSRRALCRRVTRSKQGMAQLAKAVAVKEENNGQADISPLSEESEKELEAMK